MDPDAEQAVETEPSAPLYFGNYEVLKSIGRGKFAIVYRAKKIGDDQVVALKRIAVDMMNEKARDKCLKEVRLLQSLDHPNIIHYMDSFITENDLVIVYEWAAAGDLKRQLRKAQERGTGFEERVIWKYFSQICNAIKHMHDKRIMHRDLKPANIFLTLDGTIKVGDLGLSRELSEHTIQAHSKVGTPLYMSPEVLKGEGYDFKSDIWSLGCLLYELAMLRSPFKSEGLNLMSLFQKISNGDYQPLPDVYSEELRKLTYAMISTLPEDRPEIAQVCEKAAEMRALTAEKAKNSRKANNASASGNAITASGSAVSAQDFTKTGTLLVEQEQEIRDEQADSRPNSGKSVSKNNNMRNERDDKGDGAATPTSSHRNRSTQPVAASGTSMLPLQREGSFKLEQVNEDFPPTTAAADKRASLNPYATRPKDTQRSASGSSRDGNRGPKDLNQEQKLGNEEDDEATVGLGQADFLESQLRKAAAYNSTTTTTSNAKYDNAKYDSNNKTTTSKNNMYNSDVGSVYSHDMASASSEFPPGVVALGSDNKPTYKPDVVYGSAKGSGGGRQSAEVADEDSPIARSSNMRDSNTKSKDRDRERGAARGAERKFDAADFVSNNNTTNTSTMTNSGNNATSGATNGNSNNNGAYRRSKADGSSGGIAVGNSTSSPTNSSNSNKTTSKGNSIPRPTSNTNAGIKDNKNNNRTGLEQKQQPQDDEDNIGSRPGSVNAQYSNTRANSREGGFRAAVTGPEYTTQGRTLEQHLSDSAPAFAVMDILYTKLLILHYPMDDPYIKSEYKSTNSCRGRLLPFHFACDLQIYPTVAGHSPGYQFMQFKRAIHIATWLCGAIIRGASGEIVNRMDVHQDTPIMCAKQLLRAAQAAAVDNVMPTELVETTPTQLMSGFGLPICNLLSHLCDEALRVQGYVPKGLLHEVDAVSGNNDMEGAGADDADELMEDETALHSDAEEPHTAQLSISAEDSSSHNANAKIVSNSILLGHIDPVLWKQETERVASKLISARTRATVGTEWADHIDSLRTYSSLTTNTSTNASTNTTGGSSGGSSARRGVSVQTEALAEELRRTSTEIEKTLNKITHMESVLNRQSNVSNCAIQYAGYKNDLVEHNKKAALIQQNIAQFAQTAADLQERCDEVTETLNLKTGGEGSSCGGQNNLVRLKDGLKTMKTEIKDMTMSIAMLNNNLLEVRKAGLQRGRADLQRKQQRSKRGGARGSSGGGGGALSDPDNDVFDD